MIFIPFHIMFYRLIVYFTTSKGSWDEMALAKDPTDTITFQVADLSQPLPACEDHSAARPYYRLLCGFWSGRSVSRLGRGRDAGLLVSPDSGRLSDRKYLRRIAVTASGRRADSSWQLQASK